MFVIDAKLSVWHHQAQTQAADELTHYNITELGNTPFANQQIVPDKKGEGLPEWLTVCW